MGQLGFFDLTRRYESLDEKNDPLVAIAAMVPSAALTAVPPIRRPRTMCLAGFDRTDLLAADTGG